METNIVKVRYIIETPGKPTGDLSREYTYYSEDRLKIGDIVIVPIKDTSGRAQVSVIDVPESEIASFKDKVKTIPAESFSLVAPPLLEVLEGVELELGEELVGVQLDLPVIGKAVKDIPKDQTGVLRASPPPMTAIEPYKKTPRLVASESTVGDISLAILDISDVKTDEEYNHYNTYLSKITIELQNLEKNRLADVKAPNDYVKWLNFKYKSGEALLKQAHGHCLKILGDFRRKKQEEQQKEQDRLNAIAQRAFEKKQAEEAAARQREAEARAAEEAARKAGDAAAAEEARKAAVAAAAEAAKKATAVPVPVARVVEGMAKTTDTGEAKNIWGTEWDFELINEALLPREALMPNDKFIRGFGKLHKEKAVMAGVRFFLKDKVSVRRNKPGEPNGEWNV